MKSDRKWIVSVGVRVIAASAALALQLPQVDDWVIRLIFPDAWLVTQAVMGGMVHYVQAVAFGASITLAAEVAISLITRGAKLVAATRKRRRARPAKPYASRRAAYYDDDMKDAA